MSALNKDEFKKMCQEIADNINEQIKDMSDEEAQAFLDGVSESFFHLGDNRKEH